MLCRRNPRATRLRCPTSFLSITSIGMGVAFYRAVKRHFMSALVLTFCMSPLQSATLERLSLDDMIAKSTSIVRGKVASAYAAASGPVIYTNYTVEVSERLKGAAGSSVQVSVPGGVANGLRQTFSGAPTLNLGDEFVFFLFTGRDGRTAIIGLTQGLFALPSDGSSDPLSTRSASRELMLDRTSGRPVKDQTMVMRLSELRTRIGKATAGK
jgi:hypothetical protein